jgi:hypothetical protein
MLQLQRWLIRAQYPHYEFKWPHWDVLDPATHQPVGVIRVTPPGLKGFFRWDNPLLETRTVPDDSPVFSFRWRPALWRPPLQVWNPGGELIGTFRRKWFSVNGGYWVYDGQNRPAGELRADWTQYEFRLLNSGGQELGSVSRKLVGLPRALLYHERDYLVTAAEAIADNTGAKMLLLAAPFAASAIG